MAYQTRYKVRCMNKKGPHLSAECALTREQSEYEVRSLDLPG